MAGTKKFKNLLGRLDDSYIRAHYQVAYSIRSNSRYKHIDELLLYNGKLIKSTLGPLDLTVIPFGMTTPYVVTAAEKNRIDLVALKFYGASSLYWIICYANGLSDPLDLPVGKPLFIPSLESLREFPNPLA
jgi:hypothetical protein